MRRGTRLVALILVIEPEDVLMLVEEPLIACELVLDLTLIKFTIRNGNERTGVLTCEPSLGSPGLI